MRPPRPSHLGRAARWLVFTALLAGTLAWSPSAPLEAEAPRADVPSLAVAAPPTPPAPSRLLARVYFADAADRDQLAARLDAVETATTGGYVTAIISPDEQAALVAQGYRIEIDAARTALLNAQPPITPAQTEGIPGYECYRTVEETYAAMAGLATAHPDLAEWIDIGDSWDKVTAGGAPGYDLNVLVLTNENIPGPKPAFFLMAAIHAREYTTAELATRYAEYLVNGYGVDPDVTWLLDNFEVHILPQANPDGRHIAEGGYYQRKNVNPSGAGANDCSKPPQNITYDQFGVDLNRNASWHWNTAGVSHDKCDQTYPGPSAASEPETAAILAYIAGLFPDQRGPLIGDAAPADASGVMITLHSYGELVLFAWGDVYTPAPNKLGLQTLGRKFGFFNDYDVCQPSLCLYTTSGTTDDWTYGNLGVAAYTFEMGYDFFQSCTYFENTLVPGNLPALVYAAKAARRPYQAPAGPDTLAVTTPVTAALAGFPLTLTATADDTRYGSGGQATTEPRQNIAAARYSFDTPSWVTGTVTYPLAAADGAFDEQVEGLTAVLDTASLTAGRHLVLVESQDISGTWGVPSAVFVQITTLTSFDLSPAPSWVWGDAGQPATHTLWLTNTAAITTTFALSVTGGVWPANTASIVGPVGPGAFVPVTVAVDIPGGANPADFDQALLTVTPLTPAGPPLFAALTTVARSDFGLYVTPLPIFGFDQQGSIVTYTVSVTALGDLTDTFDIDVTGAAWVTDAPASVGPLARGETAEVTVAVHIPYGLAPGAYDTATVVFTSQGDSSFSDAATLITTAPLAPIYLPAVFR